MSEPVTYTEGENGGQRKRERGGKRERKRKTERSVYLAPGYVTLIDRGLGGGGRAGRRGRRRRAGEGNLLAERKTIEAKGSAGVRLPKTEGERGERGGM